MISAVCGPGTRYIPRVISGGPLTGRDCELAAIRRALGGGGKYSGVMIVGAAGVGKTRLAREVLAHAEAAGHRTKWIVGTESARPLPLGAFTSSISDPVSDLMPNVRRLVKSFLAQQRQGRIVIGVDGSPSAEAAVRLSPHASGGKGPKRGLSPWTIPSGQRAPRSASFPR